MSIAFPLLLVCVVLFIGALAFIAFAMGRRSKIGSVAAPCCAACRYPVEGLTSLTCPECGSDLRRVGILTPAMRRPIRVWTAIVLWSLLLPIPAFALSGLIASLAVPTRNVHETSWDLLPIAPASFEHVEVTINSTDMVWPLSARGRSSPSALVELADSMSLRVAGSPPRADGGSLHVDLEAAAWWTHSDQRRRPLSQLDTESLRRLLGSAPPPEGDADPDDIASPLRDLVLWASDNRPSPAALSSALARDPMTRLFTVQQAGSFRMVEPHPAAMVALLAFWLIFWAAGCRALYRRFRAPL